jgi:pyridoxal 5'-phosphate synthase pdxT subunit
VSSEPRPLVGVLALQGDFREHVHALEKVGADTRLVRLPEDLEDLDGLVIPGGESTTITLLLRRAGLWEPLLAILQSGLPVLATCAGTILLASRITDGWPDQESLGIVDITVRRNGYGRQLDSFEADLDLTTGKGARFPGVFIRAPVVEEVGAATVLARFEGRPVGVRQGNVVALCFHPELSEDLRLHREFVELARSAKGGPQHNTGK